MRLPIPKFLYQVSNLYRVPLNQFVPNAIRMMILFYALVKGNGGKPSADLFFSQFNYKSSGSFFYVCSHVRDRCTFLGSVPNINKEWPNHYFFVSSPTPWPLDHCVWVYKNPLPSAPSTHIHSSVNQRVIEKLNSHVKAFGHFYLPQLCSNPRLLSFFKFSPIKIPLEPGDDNYLSFLRSFKYMVNITC